MNSEAVASQEATPTFEFERQTANSARVNIIGAQFANDFGVEESAGSDGTTIETLPTEGH